MERKNEKQKIAVMTAENIDRKAIARGGEILKNGGLVAFPTETVYGLGGNALDPKASMKIYAAKGRPSDNPLIVHIADIRDLDKIVTEIPEKARVLAEKYWPGPLTMILPKGRYRAKRKQPEDWTVWQYVFQVILLHRS